MADETDKLERTAKWIDRLGFPVCMSIALSAAVVYLGNGLMKSQQEFITSVAATVDKQADSLVSMKDNILKQTSLMESIRDTMNKSQSEMNATAQQIQKLTYAIERQMSQERRQEGESKQ